MSPIWSRSCRSASRRLICSRCCSRSTGAGPAGVSARDLLARYAENRFTQPSSVDPVVLASFELRAWSSLPEGYQAHRAVAAVSARHSAPWSRPSTRTRWSPPSATPRWWRIPRNVLVLEAARRRRRLRQDPGTRFEAVRLAASQRQVRAQVFGGPGASAHFRIIGLVAAGRDDGELRLRGRGAPQPDRLPRHPDPVDPPGVAGRRGSDRPGRSYPVAGGERSSDRWPSSSRRRPAVWIRAGKSGRGYYVDACYKVFAGLPSGERREIGDGGCTTWSRQLHSDDKERTVIAGLGVDRLPRADRRSSPAVPSGRGRIGVVQIDLLFDPFDATWPDVREGAVAAEAEGFDGVWLYDHLAGSVHGQERVLECWTTLTAIAATVPRLAIGPMVLNVANRDPGTLAAMAATLQHVSGGRLLLGPRRRRRSGHALRGRTARPRPAGARRPGPPGRGRGGGGDPPGGLVGKRRRGQRLLAPRSAPADHHRRFRAQDGRPRRPGRRWRQPGRRTRPGPGRRGGPGGPAVGGARPAASFVVTVSSPLTAPPSSGCRSTASTGPSPWSVRPSLRAVRRLRQSARPIRLLRWWRPVAALV